MRQVTDKTRCHRLTTRGECKGKPTFMVSLLLDESTPIPMCSDCHRRYRKEQDHRGGLWGGSRKLSSRDRRPAQSSRLVTLVGYGINEYGLTELLYSDGSTQVL